MNLDMQLGSIAAKLEALKEGQDQLRRDLHERLGALTDAHANHEAHDDERFDRVWKQIGTLRTRFAYFLGASAAAVLLLEAAFRLLG